METKISTHRSETLEDPGKIAYTIGAQPTKKLQPWRGLVHLNQFIQPVEFQQDADDGLKGIRVIRELHAKKPQAVEEDVVVVKQVVE